jgi:nitrous oxidase accessory protein NosD
VVGYNSGGTNRSVIVVVVIIAVVASAYFFLGSYYPGGDLPTTSVPTGPDIGNTTLSDPIVIRSDIELRNMALEEGWTGNGTASGPFIIEGLRIVTNSRSCIIIQNVLEYHFILRNCYLEATHQSSGVCVKIYESANGVVENCTMVSGYQGMDFFGSTDCAIRDCTIREIGCGINTTIASNITVERNFVSDCYWAMMIGLADGIVLRSNYFDTNDIGIGAYGSNDTIVANNSITDNRVGLETDYSCQRWVITWCLFFNNTQVGIDLKSSTQFFDIYSNQFGVNLVHAQDSGASNSWDDGIAVGNAWEDYSGIGTYSIPGSAGSVDHYPTLYDP